MTEQDAKKLTDALQTKFGGQTETEEVAPGRFRFAVVSPQFVGIPQVRRQDMAWQIVDSTLTREQVIDLSLLLTFAPEEVQLAAKA